MKTAFAMLALVFTFTVTASAATPADKLCVLKGRVWSVDKLAGMRKSELLAEGINVISGRVLQVVNGGVLVSPDEEATLDPYVTVFVNGFTNKLDGDRILILAEYSGVLEYQTVLGAGKRVRKFTAAQNPTAYQVEKFHNMEHLNLMSESSKASKAGAELQRLKAEADENDRKRQAANEAQAKAARAAIAASLFADEAKQFAFYLKRAESGDPESQHAVALRLLEGRGVERNEAKACEWLAKAAAQGHTKAKARLTEMSRK